MSQIIENLKSFAIRIGKDGYPTALIEQTAERMKFMEDEIVRQAQRIKDLEAGDCRFHCRSRGKKNETSL